MTYNGITSHIVHARIVDNDFLCTESEPCRIRVRPVDAAKIDMPELESARTGFTEKGPGAMVVPVDQIASSIVAGDAVALPPCIRMKRTRVASLLRSRSASRNPNGEGLPEPRPEKLRRLIEQGIVFTGDMLPADSSAAPANG